MGLGMARRRENRKIQWEKREIIPRCESYIIPQIVSPGSVGVLGLPFCPATIEVMGKSGEMVDRRSCLLFHSLCRVSGVE